MPAGLRVCWAVKAILLTSSEIVNIVGSYAIHPKLHIHLRCVARAANATSFRLLVSFLLSPQVCLPLDSKLLSDNFGSGATQPNGSCQTRYQLQNQVCYTPSMGPTMSDSILQQFYLSSARPAETHSCWDISPANLLAWPRRGRQWQINHSLTSSKPNMPSDLRRMPSNIYERR